MANAIAVAAIVLAAVFAARKQFRKGQWTKSCVGCAGHCGCGAGGGCGHCGGSCSHSEKVDKHKRPST